MRLQLSAASWCLLFAGCADEGGVIVLQPAPPDALDPEGEGSSEPGGEAGEGSSGGFVPRLDLGASEDDGSGGGPSSRAQLVGVGSTWRVSTDAPADWTSPDFDDTAWSEAQAPVGSGYADLASELVGDHLYARIAFEAALVADEALELRLRRDDGVVAYLDGVEVGRSNVDADGVVPDVVTGVDGYTYFVVRLGAPVAGERHVLAVKISSRADGDLVFDGRLRRLGEGHEIALPIIQFRTASYGGSYSPDNVGAVWIERPDGAFVRSIAVWAAARREHLLAWRISSGGDRTDTITSATAGAHHSRQYEWDLRDAAGVRLPDGEYVLRVEFTEANSNEGSPAGPTVALPFDTTQTCSVASTQTSGIEEVVVIVPCPG